MILDWKPTGIWEPRLNNSGLRLHELERKVRRREQLSVNLWRLRSCSIWLKIGDAPSQYFFHLVKAKRIRESIKILAPPNGSLMEDEDMILQGVHAHYRKLYKWDPRVTNFQETRDEIFS